VDWPGAVPVGSLTNLQDVVGRGVTTPIFAQEPLIESRLAPRPRPAVEPAKPVIAVAVPPKKEAFTMEIIQGTKKNETKFENTGEGK